VFSLPARISFQRDYVAALKPARTPRHLKSALLPPTRYRPHVVLGVKRGMFREAPRRAAIEVRHVQVARFC